LQEIEIEILWSLYGESSDYRRGWICQRGDRGSYNARTHTISGIFAISNSLEYPHLGYFEEMLSRRDEYDYLHIAIGAVNRKGMQNRAKILDFIYKHSLPMISLISPKADIADDVVIGNGVYIGHRVIISCETVIDDAVLINQSAVIGHDCKIAKNVSIAPLVFLGGGVEIESGRRWFYILNYD